uniref:Uncharacterized protein n=1 Tax=viral metagenome TaxID=1070528 RepID=A0A6C0KUG3_9ZZZZ
MCDISTNKKYLSRPSPPRPANDIGCVGKTFVGNDGNLWTSKQNTSGIFRWVKVGGSQKVKKSGERKVRKSASKKSGERKVRKTASKKSGERKVRKTASKKSGERKMERVGPYKISFALKYIHKQGTKPTKAELEDFYKKESFKEVKDILTQYSYPINISDMITNIRMTKTGIISFSLPKTLSKTIVEDFVNRNIRYNSLADGSWEASPGTGLVYYNKNVIGFGSIKVAI